MGLELVAVPEAAEAAVASMAQALATMKAVTGMQAKTTATKTPTMKTTTAKAACADLTRPSLEGTVLVL